MPEQKSAGYFPERLLSRLRAAREHSITMVLAPTGYGKTRAIKQMALEIPEGTFHWFSAFWEDALGDWERLCELISSFNPQAGAELLALGGGTSVNVHDGLRALDKLRGPEGQDTYLVIDHFNKMMTLFPPVLLGALFRLNRAGMHVVLMGHPFQIPLQVSYDPYAINWIGAKDLAFSPEEISAFYALEGISLGADEAQALYEQTGGWPAPLAIHRNALKANPDSDEAPRVSQLIAQVFFDRLEREERLLLMCLSKFEKVTESDISLLTTPGENVADRAQMLLRVPMMQHDFGDQTFILPKALRAFLAARLKNSPQADREEACRRLARRFGKHGQVACSIGCYFEIKDYEAILSLELKLLVFEKAGDYPIEVVARDIVENCPTRIKEKYPLSMLRLAYILFGCGDYAGYDLAMAQARDMIDPETSLQLYGEWLVISMFRYLPDVEKMHQLVLEASEYLLYPPRVLSVDEPFLFGCPSMWFLFYHTPGQGDRIAEQIEKWLIDYQKINTGRGVGASLLFRGELASMRCEYDKAAAFANSAAALGEQAGQATVVYGAALLMARNAIAQRDYQGVQQALEYLEERFVLFPALQGTAINREMKETVRSLILSMMLETGLGSEPFLVGYKTDYADSVMAQMTLHIRVVDLILEKKPEKALALLEAALIRGDRLCNTVMRYMANLAIAMYSMVEGRHHEATQAMREVLEIAYEDRLMASIVNHRELLRSLLKSPAFGKYRAFITAIYAPGRKKTVKPVQDTPPVHALPSSLTNREREVAMWAARGLRNPEIAKKLYITESTVKKHMQIVFEKLNIDRRSKLVEMLRGAVEDERRNTDDIA